MKTKPSISLSHILNMPSSITKRLKKSIFQELLIILVTFSSLKIYLLPPIMPKMRIYKKALST